MNKTIKNLLVGVLAGFVVIFLFGYWIWQDKEAQGYNSGELPVSYKNSHNATSTYRGNDDDSDGGYMTSTSTDWLIPGSVFTAWDSSEISVYPYIATGTQQYNIENASVITFGMQIVSSTTASVSFEAKISYDGSSWYDFIPTVGVNTGNANFSDAWNIASSTLFTYTDTSDGGGTNGGDATSTPSFSLDLRNTAAKYLRLFYGAGTASTTVRIQAFWR